MEAEPFTEGTVSALFEQFSPATFPQAATDAAGLDYCLFRCGDDFFAIPLTLVDEIVPNPVIAEVPASPPFLLGTIEVNGDTLPVIDLALCSGPLTDPKFCMVLTLNSGDAPVTLAVAVDELLWPTARPTTACGAMQFAKFEAASRFISGRITYGAITAWALDPAQLTNALFASVMD